MNTTTLPPGRVIFARWEDTLPGVTDESVDLLLTDPPYGMEYVSNRRSTGPTEAIDNDNNLEWLWAWIAEIKRVMKPDAHGYIFVSHHFYYKFVAELIAAGIPVKNTLIWRKNNHGAGDLEGDYAPQYEMIIFISNGVKKLNGKRESNILTFAKTDNALHPTQKPEPLVRYLILKSSNPGDLVLDTFGGSGTTAVSAEIEGRKWIVCEMKGKYVQVANDRLARLRNAPTLFSAAG